MIISLRCECGTSAKVEVDPAKFPHLDPRAVACRALSEHGWRYRGGKIGKSVVSILCPDCHRALGILTLEADFLPGDVVPGTHEDDLSV